MAYYLILSSSYYLNNAILQTGVSDLLDFSGVPQYKSYIGADYTSKSSLK